MKKIIVIGAGHAGVEASIACAKLGFSTTLISPNFNKAGNMPCNPSMGGPAKGIIMREIDSLGGVMAKNADKCVLQMKMLNESKGPAVQALRAQIDKLMYPREVLCLLKKTKNLTLLEKQVEKITFENQKVTGVILKSGETLFSDAVILATGTYLKSKILRGKTKVDLGPEGDDTSYGISKSLKEMGFMIRRYKTGTPPRLLKTSIDYKNVLEQEVQNKIYAFSSETDLSLMKEKINKVKCFLTFTNEKTHRLIKENLFDSSMYGGLVEGVGPRYCPSIEDKVVRFSDKERHQIFLEPESLELDTIYVQGVSTSFSEVMQEKIIHSINGLENAKILKYAYAIEYDAIDSQVLKHSLESKLIENLFFAGQINGTSGYEEAAAQGLIAGINAARKLKSMPPLILKRDEAYIGVLIDDLVIKGVIDPYRMLTSRADHRLLLRHDNADDRLLEKGFKIGLISKERFSSFQNQKLLETKLLSFLETSFLMPSNKVNAFLLSKGIDKINVKTSLKDFLKRPGVSFKVLEEIFEIPNEFKSFPKESLEIKIKYEGYILKEKKIAQKLLVLESVKIPSDIDYDKIKNLASEAREKLKKIKPETLAQASRISGVNPSDVSILMIYIEANRGRKNN